MNKKQAYYWRLLTHKWKILKFTSSFCLKMMKRAIIHDNSKFSYRERDLFLAGDIDAVEKKYGYGSPEYYQELQKVKGALELHYFQNSHHPQNHPNGIWDMNLNDFLEMYLDWKAASPDLLDSIMKNETRFDIAKQITALFINQATCDKDIHF